MLHGRDALLDVALARFLAGGVAALSMAGVARDAGAPSGSLYHRFGARPGLLAALWLRTSERFQEAHASFLGAPPTVAGAISAAGDVVTWCGAHLAEAVVLQAGPEAFEPATWPAEDQAALDALAEAIDRRIRAAVRAVATEADRPRREVAFALVDLPLAVVRPHLLAGRPPSPAAAGLARDLARRLLAPHPA